MSMGIVIIHAKACIQSNLIITRNITDGGVCYVEI